MSKFKDFLEAQKLDPRRVVAVSKKLEGLRPEDRAVRLAKTRVRQGKPTDQEKELAEKKPRSGRPVSMPTIHRALEGETISGAARTRVLRAVNKLLADKKKSEVNLADLF
ncbi:MAG: hypothetical protein AAGF12_04625 [Myxococcota bacterium]